jgi:hypothetical protein
MKITFGFPKVARDGCLFFWTSQTIWPIFPFPNNPETKLNREAFS